MDFSKNITFRLWPVIIFTRGDFVRTEFLHFTWGVHLHSSKMEVSRSILLMKSEPKLALSSFWISCEDIWGVYSMGIPRILKKWGEHRVKRSEWGGGCRGAEPLALEFLKICLEIMGLRVKILNIDTIHGKL